MKYRFRLLEAPGDENPFATQQQAQPQSQPQAKPQNDTPQGDQQDQQEPTDKQQSETPEERSDGDKANGEDKSQSTRNLKTRILQKPKEQQDYYAFVVAMYLAKFRGKEYSEVIKYHNDLYGYTASFYNDAKIKSLLDAMLPVYFNTLNLEAKTEEEAVSSALEQSIKRYGALAFMTKFDNKLKNTNNVDKIVFVIKCYTAQKIPQNALKNPTYNKQVFDVLQNYENNVADFCYIFSAYTLAFNMENSNPNRQYIVDGHWKSKIEVEAIYQKGKENDEKSRAEKTSNSVPKGWSVAESNTNAINTAYNLINDDNATGEDGVKLRARNLAQYLFDRDIQEYNRNIKLQLPNGYKWMSKRQIAKALSDNDSWKAFYGVEQ